MAGEHLRRTHTSTGSKKKFTYSLWFKSNIKFTSNSYFFGLGGDGSSYDDSRLYVSGGNSNALSYTATDVGVSGVTTDDAIRDCGNWYHFMVVVDTTIAHENDRVKLYINGVRKDVSYITTAAQNANISHNTAGEILLLGSYNGATNFTAQGLYSDIFNVDGQALTPDVFGFYKDGDGYQSSGTSNATDFRPGQWSPRLPKSIKYTINRNGGFGVNGFYLPMNDSSNPGADFHCAPNSIIKLKGEDLPQPRNGAPTTSDAYVSQLRQEVSTLGFDGVVKFDGDGDYLSLSTTSDFAFGTGDFTVEFWAWIESSKSTTLQPIFDNDYNSAGGLAIAIRHSDSRIFVGDNGSGLNLCQFNAPFALNYWNHFAVVADSGTYKAFVNGTSCSLGSGSATVVNTSKSSGTTEIGRLVGQTSIAAAAFISNLRVVKGTALYTANFTAPTEPLTNVTNTKLLCCNSSTSATAATVTPGTITANGNAFATRNELTGSIVVAVPGISTSTSANLIANGNFDSNVSGWTATDSTVTWENGQMKVQRTAGGGLTVNQAFTTVAGQRYTISGTINSSTSRGDLRVYNGSGTGGSLIVNLSGTNGSVTDLTGSFTATSTTSTVVIAIDTNNGVVYVDNVVVKQEDAPRDYSADIKGSGSNKTLTAAGNAGVGYELGGYYDSAMQLSNDGTNGAGNTDVINVPTSSDFVFTGDVTMEGWIYPTGTPSTASLIFGQWRSGGGTDRNMNINFDTSNRVIAYFNSSATNYNTGLSSALALNQWHHIATEKHGSNFTLYVNGVAVGVNVNTPTAGNTSTVPFTIGSESDGSNGADYGFNGYIQDVRVYKGVAKYKGGFDVPKPYTPVGIEAFRTTADTCKNNFATLNSLSYQTTGTYGTSYPVLSDGNLKITQGQTGQWERSNASFGVGEGKWYCEFQIVSRPTGGTPPNNSENWAVGVRESDSSLFYGDTDGFEDLGDHVYWIDANTAKIVSNQDRSAGSTSGISNVVNGDIINIAFEKTATTLKVWFGINGTYFNSGNPSSGTTPAVNVSTTTEYIIPAAAFYQYTGQVEPVGTFNFGQNPSFSGQTTAGTNADGNGKGLFKYAPPTGFLALCEDNLPTPAIADPGKHFKTVLYTGSQTPRSIQGLGFKPDLVWIKARSEISSHVLYDSVRGPTIGLFSNRTDVEETDSNNLTSFDNNGFSLGTGYSSTGVNGDGRDYVAWCWKAGGAAVSNTDGTITSQVSVNQTAGFSVGTFSGNLQANQSIGHGLGKVPAMVVVKERNSNSGWAVYHKARGNTKVSYWNIPDTEFTETGTSASWATTDPTSDVFYVGANGATNDNNLAFYAWAEIEGFSKFGSYIGNNDADGPAIFCGFKPAFLMIKLVTGSERDWHIYDSSRNPTNPVGLNLRPSNASADTDEPGIDFLSNGFKIRSDYIFSNESGQTIIFAAFAESPFQTANSK